MIVIRAKDRFNRPLDSGYRDMLLNLRCEATGHIVEVQITLDPLIAIKAGGGHANYAIARVHRLFERDIYRYEGALGDAVLEGVRCGVVRVRTISSSSAGQRRSPSDRRLSRASASCARGWRRRRVSRRAGGGYAAFFLSPARAH